MGTLPEDQCTYLKISRLIILRVRNVSKGFLEKIKTLFNYIDFSQHNNN